MRRIRLAFVPLVSLAIGLSACGKGSGGGSSSSCGATGQACCGSSTGTCNTGLACQAGTCQAATAACGGQGQPCCTTGTTCVSSLVCRSGSCGAVLTDSQSRKICKDGGKLEVNGATLELPKGALATCTFVKLSVTKNAAPGYSLYSPVISVEPKNLDLSVPATLSIATSGAPPTATAFWSLPSGGLYEPLNGSLAADVVSSEITRFGDGFVAGRDYVLVCAEGATLETSGATLTIPKDALSTCTMVSLSASSEEPRVYSRYSPVFSIATADDVPFAHPASLTLDYSGDADRATMFESRADTTGYAPIAQALSSGNMSGPVGRPGTVFVANGVDFVDLPDPSCVVTRKVDDGRTLSASSTVAVFFTADDCWGRPMPGLKAKAFSLRENGTTISSTEEASATILSQKGVEVFVSLVLDLSASTLDPSATQLPRLPDVIAGAQSFVQDLRVTKNLPVRFGIQFFDGRAQPVKYLDYTLSSDDVLDALEKLKSYDPKSTDPANPANAFAAPADPTSTNLNGAVKEGLSSLAAAESDFRTRSDGGAFTVGYLVLFTDGRDTAHRVPFDGADSATAAVAASNDTVVAVGLESAEYSEGTLEALATGGVITARAQGQLSTAFAALSNRIKLQLERFYLLGYCSPSREGDKNIVEVQVVGATMRSSAAYQFNAASFGPGCSTQTFQELCVDKQCGGLGCGFCAEGLTCSGAATGICQ